ncbi:MAG: pyridoxal phosphate-dependent aminotransferase family protein [Caldilineaceae bacterium]
MHNFGLNLLQDTERSPDHGAAGEPFLAPNGVHAAAASPTLPHTDGFTRKIEEWWQRTETAKEEDLYYYFQPVDEIDGPWVVTEGQRKLMFATYSYLGLLNHPRIAAAAKAAVDKYGTGTHGVRILGGTLDLHVEMEATVAGFVEREDAIVYPTGYVTNLATISAGGPRRLGDLRQVEPCQHRGRLPAGARHFARYRHNDMHDLEKRLSEAPAGAGKLVVADAVFSMDGDILDLPTAVALCQRYNARLMVDEAHSLGVLGATGSGIEEHFDMPGAIDIKMGTLSKTIPGVGGYIAGDRKLINYLRHTARGFVFSAAVAPPVAAAIIEAFHVLEDEAVERNQILSRNVRHFIEGLQAHGFDTGLTVTPIVPIMVGTEARAMSMTRYCQHHGVFVLPVLPPAVPEGGARLRANVTAAHSAEDIDFAVSVFAAAGREAGVI